MAGRGGGTCGCCLSSASRSSAAQAPSRPHRGGADPASDWNQTRSSRERGRCNGPRVGSNSGPDRGRAAGAQRDSARGHQLGLAHGRESRRHGLDQGLGLRWAERSRLGGRSLGEGAVRERQLGLLCRARRGAVWQDARAGDKSRWSVRRDRLQRALRRHGAARTRLSPRDNRSDRRTGRNDHRRRRHSHDPTRSPDRRHVDHHDTARLGPKARRSASWSRASSSRRRDCTSYTRQA